jgi:hypothetical protein
MRTVLRSLFVAAAIAATAGSIAATAVASPAVTITSAGRIGPLRLDRSDHADIVAFAGAPEVENTVFGSPGAPGAEALGYRCESPFNPPPLAAPTGDSNGDPFCRTVYYINLETERLGTFFTSLTSFRDGHGVRVGITTAQADRKEGVPALSGCGSAIRIQTATAALNVDISGGGFKREGNKMLTRGGRVGALVLHSARHDVDVFDCE